MVCCVSTIGMDSWALTNLRITEIFCLTQKVACQQVQEPPIDTFQ